MIRSFRHKGLRELFKEGKTRHIGGRYIEKCAVILTMLEEAETLEDLNVPGFRFHGLSGSPPRWSLRVNKNYRITFEWRDGAADVDFEDYH